MKRLFFVTLLFTLASALFGVESILKPEEQPWRVMETARIAFSRQDYGTALRQANLARELKKREFTWYRDMLQRELAATAVRAAGDDIDSVLQVLRDRDADTAIGIIAYFTEIYGLSYYNHSLAKLLEHLEKMTVLPEAEELIGDVYLVEGETKMARRYYIDAYDSSYALDVPEHKYDLLYKLAHVGDLEGDDELYEQSLLLILADDPFARGFQDLSGSFVRAVTRAVDQSYSADKFFLMYRCTTFRSLKAYLDLAAFYRERGETEKYFACAALGAITAFTKIHKALENRELEYRYTTLDDLFLRAGRHEDIRLWMGENNVTPMFSLFAEAAALRGQPRLAMEIRGKIS